MSIELLTTHELHEIAGGHRHAAYARRPHRRLPPVAPPLPPTDPTPPLAPVEPAPPLDASQPTNPAPIDIVA